MLFKILPLISVHLFLTFPSVVQFSQEFLTFSIFLVILPCVWSLTLRDANISGTSPDINYFSYQSGGVRMKTQLTQLYWEGVSGILHEILNSHPEIHPHLLFK